MLEIKIKNLVKHKYTIWESARILENLIQNGAMDNKPNFIKAIDDIQIEYRKQIKIDRLKEKPHIPLSLNNKFDIDLSNFVNEKMDLKIPQNNPLANFGKAFNKFDEFDPSN